MQIKDYLILERFLHIIDRAILNDIHLDVDLCGEFFEIAHKYILDGEDISTVLNELQEHGFIQEEKR